MATIEELAREGHGAIQVDSPTEPPLRVMLAGPIKYWWSCPPQEWEKGDHGIYVQWRDAVDAAFVKAGFLVYRAHMAWRGSWDEMAQLVNDRAIEVCHVLVDLTPPYIPAEGTAAEVAYAESLHKVIVNLPPSVRPDMIDLAIEIMATKVPRT